MDNNYHDDYNSQPDTDGRPYTPAPGEQERRPRRKKKLASATSTALITILLLAVIGFIAFKIWGGGFGVKGQVGNLTTNAISNMSFKGVVTGFKFDDDKRHSKNALLSDGNQYAIYEPWVYDIDAGDTLIKQKGKLKIEIRRPHKKVEVLDYEPILRKFELTGRL